MNTAERDRARNNILLANQRAAEASFGRYAQRYVTSLEDATAPATYYQGAGSNDLLRSVEYVTAVREGGAYKSVNLYDRVEGRHVTLGDIRKLRAQLDLPG